MNTEFYICTDYDQTPAARNPETGALILLDAAYGLHDALGERGYEATIREISDYMRDFGMPNPSDGETFGEVVEATVTGVDWWVA